MIQLRPTEVFTIVRQIDDPLDTATYYVQAKVRNAQNDDLLETVNLTDKGDQRFRGDYEVPVDGSGLGFYITITTRTYTDSGYTSESERYGVEEREYLVQERYNHNIGGGHAGSGVNPNAGVDISYKKIKEIIEEELKKLIFPEQKEVDLLPIIKSIDGIKTELMMLKIPDLKDIDFKDVIDSINTAKDTLDKQIGGNKQAIDKYRPAFETANKEVDGLMDRVKEFLNKDLSKIEEKLNKLDTSFNKIPFVSMVDNTKLDRKEVPEKKEEKQKRRFF